MLNPLGSASSRLLSPLGMASKGFTYQQKVLGYTPAGYWPLNGNANDISGNGYNGTPNAVTWDAVAGAGNTMGLAPSFDGASSYITMGDVLDIGSTSLTILVWARKASNKNFGLVGKSVAGSQLGRYSILSQDAGTNIELLTQLPANESAPTGWSSYALNTWICVIGRIARSGAASIYIDGVLKATGASIDATNYNTLYSFMVGAYQNASGQPSFAGFFFGGNIAHVAVFQSALSLAAITDLSIAS